MSSECVSVSMSICLVFGALLYITTDYYIFLYLAILSEYLTELDVYGVFIAFLYVVLFILISP